MSIWLKDGEVLVGQGSGQGSPCPSRSRVSSVGGSWPGRLRGLTTSPSREEWLGMVAPETMGKAGELFVLCDKEGKGFITKRDMQRLQGELPLSPEQLESVFDSLDRESNGFLTPVEFSMGLDELVGEDELIVEEEIQEVDPENMLDHGELRLTQILTELGGDKLFTDQWELRALWCELHQDRPDLLSILENVLVQALSHLQESLKERDSLEHALRRRESEHDRIVQSLYEDMDSQLREEREKQRAQDSVRQWDRKHQLQEELRTQELELDSALVKISELEKKIQQLTCEQAEIRGQNQQLEMLNLQFQEQLEVSREQLHDALDQLSLIQSHSTQEQMSRQRNVMKVSKNMQTEKDSLMRQLELLRDMNKKLRDETDARHSQKTIPNISMKRGSIIGTYIPQDKPVKSSSSRSSSHLSSSSHSDQEEVAISNSTKKRRPTSSTKHSRDNDEPARETEAKITGPLHVFKVVFLGSSGVGKSSFIQRYCTGQFSNTMTSTVGLDFQVRTVPLGFTTVVLQLWDTGGQERFSSISQQYYRKADGILAMYDIIHSPSFSEAKGWLDRVQEECEGAAVMLLGNKSDMDGEQREVTTMEGRQLAEQYQVMFYECSAKSGHNIEELMTQLAGLLSSKQDQHSDDALVLEDHATSRGGCCK